MAVCCQALERRPGEVPLLIQRARAWIALGRHAQAIDDLREVLALDPLCGSAYLALGRLLVDGGELLAARRAFLGALALDPGDGQAREQLEAVEAALIVDEALALELALADAPSGESRAPSSARAGRHRLPTQPMGRSATGGAWRAPTMPLARAAERHERGGPRPGRDRAHRAELPLGEASERKVSSPRASTLPMGYGAVAPAPWRAPTMPVRRSAQLALVEDPGEPRADEPLLPTAGEAQAPRSRAVSRGLLRRAETAPLSWHRAGTVPLRR